MTESGGLRAELLGRGILLTYPVCLVTTTTEGRAVESGGPLGPYAVVPRQVAGRPLEIEVGAIAAEIAGFTRWP